MRRRIASTEGGGRATAAAAVVAVAAAILVAPEPQRRRTASALNTACDDKVTMRLTLSAMLRHSISLVSCAALPQERSVVVACGSSSDRARGLPLSTPPLPLFLFAAEKLQTSRFAEASRPNVSCRAAVICFDRQPRILVELPSPMSGLAAAFVAPSSRTFDSGVEKSTTKMMLRSFDVAVVVHDTWPGRPNAKLHPSFPRVLHTSRCSSPLSSQSHRPPPTTSRRTCGITSARKSQSTSKARGTPLIAGSVVDRDAFCGAFSRQPSHAARHKTQTLLSCNRLCGCGSGTVPFRTAATWNGKGKEPMSALLVMRSCRILRKGGRAWPCCISCRFCV